MEMHCKYWHERSKELLLEISYTFMLARRICWKRSHSFCGSGVMRSKAGITGDAMNSIARRSSSSDGTCGGGSLV